MQRALLSLGAIILALLILEIFVRLPGVEGRLIAPLLYLQAADLPVHRVSGDAFLHYELAPGSRLEARTPNGTPYAVNIDSFGARCPTHPRIKGPNVFRVLCVGGSTMYGAGINDDQTLPAALERRLNHDSMAGNQMRFEAWNFGTSAYTLGQAAHLARMKLAELDPDLILVQHHNIGRRPFLATPDLAIDDHPPELQRPGADFFLEQFPAPSDVPIDVHRMALELSALYRSLTALQAWWVGADGWVCDRCDEISASEARNLSSLAESRGVAVLYVTIPADGSVRPPDIFPELPAERFIRLFQPGREPQFYEVHPPPDVLDEYAAIIVETLRERKLLTSQARGDGHFSAAGNALTG